MENLCCSRVVSYKNVKTNFIGSLSYFCEVLNSENYGIWIFQVPIKDFIGKIFRSAKSSSVSSTKKNPPKNFKIVLLAFFKRKLFAEIKHLFEKMYERKLNLLEKSCRNNSHWNSKENLSKNSF